MSRRSPRPPPSAPGSAPCARRWACRYVTSPSAAAYRRRCSRRWSVARPARRWPSRRGSPTGLDLSLSQLLRLDEGGHVASSAAAEGRTRAARRPPGRGADPAAAGAAGRRLLPPARRRAPPRAGAGDPPLHEPGSRETAVVLEGAVPGRSMASATSCAPETASPSTPTWRTTSRTTGTSRPSFSPWSPPGLRRS